MNPYEVSQDPKWYRYADAAVLLTIGVIIGFVAAYGVLLPGMQTTETIQRIPVKMKSDASQHGTVDPAAASDMFFVIEES
jgi:hypothetical protein